MKRLLTSLVCIITITCTLLACGSSKNEVVEFSVANSMSSGDSVSVALDYLVKELKDKSNGTLVGTTFHDAQLGSQRDYIDGMQMGSIHIAECSTALLSGIESKFTIFDMPYISDSVEKTQRVLEQGVGQILSDSLEEKGNIKIIGWVVRTPRNVYSSKGPINTPDDFKNLKIRTMETPVVMKAMDLLGAKPTPIPGTERYMALQTKVVDAAENSSSEILMKKEYEVTKYLSKTAHLIQPNPICVGKKFFDSLSKQQQQLLLEVGKAAGEYGTKIEIENLVEVEKKLEEKGMIINDIKDRSKFVEKVKPLYEEYLKDFGQEILDAFQKEN